MSKPSDPADKELAKADGLFQPNHRSGYGTVEARTAWVIDWVTRHPHCTLAGGEGALLVKRIRDLEAALEHTEALHEGRVLRDGTITRTP
jgi:hypothetical protein